MGQEILAGRMQRHPVCLQVAWVCGFPWETYSVTFEEHERGGTVLSEEVRVGVYNLVCDPPPLYIDKYKMQMPNVAA